MNENDSQTCEEKINCRYRNRQLMSTDRYCNISYVNQIYFINDIEKNQ
jgi:hypothetical protein